MNSISAWQGRARYQCQASNIALPAFARTRLRTPAVATEHTCKCISHGAAGDMYTFTNYVIAKQNAEVELSRAPATCCHLGDLVVVVSCNKAAGCMVGFARTVRRGLSLLSLSPTP